MERTPVFSEDVVGLAPSIETKFIYDRFTDAELFEMEQSGLNMTGVRQLPRRGLLDTSKGGFKAFGNAI